MADHAVVVDDGGSRRMRPASLSSSSDAEDDDAGSKKQFLRAAGRALEAARPCGGGREAVAAGEDVPHHVPVAPGADAGCGRLQPAGAACRIAAPSRLSLPPP